MGSMGRRAWQMALIAGALAGACSSDEKSKDAGGSSGSDVDASDGKDGGSSGGTSNGASAGDGGPEIASNVRSAIASLIKACETIAQRERDCGAIGTGDTSCDALTAGWIDSDLGFGPELEDLAQLDAAALQRALGVDERKCKAACATEAECSDVIAEARDGACEGAPDYKGSYDACRDLCEDRFDGYACGDGEFVSDNERCDGTKDCVNGRDEMCVTLAYDCGAGSEAMHAQPADLEAWNPECDGKVDCTATGKDEKGCSKPAFACSASEFVANDDVCDGKTQCMTGEDEADCREFDCGDGERIPARGVCDSDVSCKNHSDDLDCPGWFVCADGTGAIAGDQVCEISDFSDEELAALDAKGLTKLYDCPDKSDETRCARVICK